MIDSGSLSGTAVTLLISSGMMLCVGARKPCTDFHLHVLQWMLILCLIWF